MASDNVMVDDVVGQRHNGEYRYGAVVQSFSEGEEESSLDPGCILVEWYPEGTGDDIDQSKVEILDRALMPRDIVYKSHNELGTVLDTHKTADLMIVGTDKKMKDIDADKLQYITRFIGGEIVSYGPWIGQISGVERMVYVKTMTHNRGCIGENLLADLSVIEDPHPHKSDKGGYEGLPHGSSIFYPGQTLQMPPRAAKFISWLPNGVEPSFPKNSQVKLVVKWVVMSSVSVKWIQSSGLSDDEDQRKYLKELGIENGRKPAYRIKSAQLKWLKGVNTFRNCCYSLGHRLLYTLTADDVHELNKSIKKRKRKHKARKGHRNESLDRKQRRKSAASTSGIKRRFQQQRPNHRPDDESSSDEYEDVKETTQEHSYISLTDRTTQDHSYIRLIDRTPQDQAYIILTDRAPQDKTSTITTTTKQQQDENEEVAVATINQVETDADSEPQTKKMKSAVARKLLLDAAEEEEKGEDDDADEEMQQQGKGDAASAEPSPQSFVFQSALLKVYGIRMSERKAMLMIELNKPEAGSETADTPKGPHKAKEELLELIKNKLNWTISNPEVNHHLSLEKRTGEPFAVCLERGRKKAPNTVTKHPMLVHSEENSNYERECTHVTFQAGSKKTYFAGQQVTIEIAMTSTQAKVQWQDATETENNPSTELTPTETLNDNDFFPGDYVTDMRQKCKDLFRYGVIQKAFSKRRMAVVKWFTFKITSLTTLGIEEVSIYDLQASNDFRYRVSDVVYLLGKVDGQISEFDHTQYTGQVLRITTDGKLQIIWSTGVTSHVYPHEVVLYNEEDANGALSDILSDEDSDDDDDLSCGSWTTVTSDEDDEICESQNNDDEDGESDKDMHESDMDDDADDEEEDVLADFDVINGQLRAIIDLEEEDMKEEEEKEEEEKEEEEEEKVVEIEEMDEEAKEKSSQFQMLTSAPKSHKFYNYPHHAACKKFIAAHRRDMKLFMKNPPKNIYVRAYEDRMDLMSAMIVGPDNTPFRDSLFMFEIYFPRNYPDTPPKVHFISFTTRLNPNLYENGTVCVSLLGTWSGHGSENWTKDSSILQVLLSIQVLILNKEPYFNEAGYEPQRNTDIGRIHSRWYNDMVVRRMVEHVKCSVTSPPLPFADDAQYRSLLKENLPNFIARNRALIKASEEANSAAAGGSEDGTKSSEDVDLSELAGFPLLCLSQGVLEGLPAQLDLIEKSARERNLL